MCMSYDHPKPIRMHAFTLFNDMRHPKLPQRLRGSPGAFTFFKNFEHTRTNQYIPLPPTQLFLRCPSWSCARRRRQMCRFEPLHRTGLRRAAAWRQLSAAPICVTRPFWEFCVTRNFFLDDLCHQSGSLTPNDTFVGEKSDYRCDCMVERHWMIIYVH